LKSKPVKLLTHTPFTQSLKHSVPISFPLKSWPAVVAVDRDHIGHRGRERITLDTLQGSVGPLWRISPCQLLTMTTPGLPTWSKSLVQVSISLHQSEGLVHGSAASFSHLEGDPGIALGVHNFWFQGPLQAAEPGNGDRYPMGLGGLISLGPPKCCGKTVRPSDHREQDSNPGGWMKGRFITLAGQHLDLSKMALAL
jgi:hypothetical protein